MTDSYKHPKWQRKRLEILQRDNWSCVACKATESTLHVHHAFYDGEPWDIPNEWLQTLCESCHEFFGPHPKAGVYWHAYDQSKSAVVAVCWCPQCGGLKFKENGGFPKCVACGWDCWNYGERGFVLGPKVELLKDEPKKKSKEYSLAWLRGMMTKVKKGGATEIQIFDSIFPSHPAIEMVKSLHDASLEFIAKKTAGQLSLQDEIAAVSALITARKTIEDILSSQQPEATDGNEQQ